MTWTLGNLQENGTLRNEGSLVIAGTVFFDTRTIENYVEMLISSDAAITLTACDIKNYGQVVLDGNASIDLPHRDSQACGLMSA